MWIYWNVSKFASLGDAIECCWDVAKQDIGVSLGGDGYNISWQTWVNDGVELDKDLVDLSYIECILQSTTEYCWVMAKFPFEGEKWERVPFKEVAINQIFWDLRGRPNCILKKVDAENSVYTGHIKPINCKVGSEYVYVRLSSPTQQSVVPT